MRHHPAIKLLGAIAHTVFDCFLARVVVPFMDWALTGEPPEYETYRPWTRPEKEEGR